MQLDSKNSSIFAVAELFPVPLVDTGEVNDNDLNHDFVDSHLFGSAKDIVDDLSCVCLEVSCCQFLGKIFSIFFLKSPAANFLGIYSQNSVLKSPAANFWGKYSQYSVFFKHQDILGVKEQVHAQCYNIFIASFFFASSNKNCTRRKKVTIPKHLENLNKASYSAESDMSAIRLRMQQ